MAKFKAKSIEGFQFHRINGSQDQADDLGITLVYQNELGYAEGQSPVGFMYKQPPIRQIGEVLIVTPTGDRGYLRHETFRMLFEPDPD